MKAFFGTNKALYPQDSTHGRNILVNSLIRLLPGYPFIRYHEVRYPQGSGCLASCLWEKTEVSLMLNNIKVGKWNCLSEYRDINGPGNHIRCFGG